MVKRYIIFFPFPWYILHQSLSEIGIEITWIIQMDYIVVVVTNVDVNSKLLKLYFKLPWFF